MKSSLALCSLALNPLAPSPTASMVRVADGRMEAFGGTFCISTPCKLAIGACFNPALLAPFFRKERKAVAYTVKKDKLTAQDGKEKLTVRCLPPEELVTIDVLGKPEPVELDLTYLKNCLDVVDPASGRAMLQGVSFRNGMMEASNGHSLVSTVTDLELEPFNLPHDSAKALLKFKSPITGISLWEDGNMVKFHHKDGSTLTSLLITEQLVDTSPLYQGTWKKLKLDADCAKDLLSIDCERVIIERGGITYIRDTARGTLDGVCDPAVSLTLLKKSLDVLLRVASDIRIDETLGKAMAVSENCRAISMGIRS